MRFRLYNPNYGIKNAVIDSPTAFIAFGLAPIALHAFTVRYDLFQGLFVALAVVSFQAAFSFFVKRRKNLVVQ